MAIMKYKAIGGDRYFFSEPDIRSAAVLAKSGLLKELTFIEDETLPPPPLEIAHYNQTQLNNYFSDVLFERLLPLKAALEGINLIASEPVKDAFKDLMGEPKMSHSFFKK